MDLLWFITLEMEMTTFQRYEEQCYLKKEERDRETSLCKFSVLFVWSTQICKGSHSAEPDSDLGVILALGSPFPQVENENSSSRPYTPQHISVFSHTHRSFISTLHSCSLWISYCNVYVLWKRGAYQQPRNVPYLCTLISCDYLFFKIVIMWSKTFFTYVWKDSIV